MSTTACAAFTGNPLRSRHPRGHQGHRAHTPLHTQTPPSTARVRTHLLVSRGRAALRRAEHDARVGVLKHLAVFLCCKGYTGARAHMRSMHVRRRALVGGRARRLEGKRELEGERALVDPLRTRQRFEGERELEGERALVGPARTRQRLEGERELEGERALVDPARTHQRLEGERELEGERALVDPARTRQRLGLLPLFECSMLAAGPIRRHRYRNTNHHMHAYISPSMPHMHMHICKPFATGSIAEHSFAPVNAWAPGAAATPAPRLPPLAAPPAPAAGCGLRSPGNLRAAETATAAATAPSAAAAAASGSAAGGGSDKRDSRASQRLPAAFPRLADARLLAIRRAAAAADEAAVVARAWCIITALVATRAVGRAVAMRGVARLLAASRGATGRMVARRRAYRVSRWTGGAAVATDVSGDARWLHTSPVLGMNGALGRGVECRV
eukprot:366576-Chlamydomonas_euryale.AAC.9